MKTITSIINFIWKCFGTFQTQQKMNSLQDFFESNFQNFFESTLLVYQRDWLIDLFTSENAPNKDCTFQILTEHSFALNSPDYYSPTDFREYKTTRSQRFVCKVEQIFQKKPVKHIDLGCGRGGITLDFLLRKNISVGLDGTDVFSTAFEREWDILGGKNLFTADVCEEFKIFYKEKKGKEEPFQADIITAFELLEHLPEEKLSRFFKNIADHLTANGLFVCSISYGSYMINGIEHHICRHPKDWWISKMGECGFVPVENNPFHPYDFPRGCDHNYDFIKHPELGCHLVMQKNR